MKVLVITNQYKGGLNLSLLNVFSAVNALNVKCDVIVVGYQLTEVANLIASYALVDKVITLDDARLSHIIVDNISKQLADEVKSYSHIFMANDDFGKNLLPRIAALANYGQLSEVTKVISANVYQKFVYTGNVLIEVEVVDEIKFLTIRCANFDEYNAKSGVAAAVENLPYSESQLAHKINYLGVEYSSEVGSHVDLTHAKVVVTGGRSLLTKENFDSHIRRLAKLLNAGVGSTRAAVEEGITSNDCQVGQTGKTVSPDIYLAVGISGAVQHIMGMKGSRMVIAINNDRSAPIFDYADYGMVADLFTVVPELINKLS